MQRLQYVLLALNMAGTAGHGQTELACVVLQEGWLS